MDNNIKNAVISEGDNGDSIEREEAEVEIACQVLFYMQRSDMTSVDPGRKKEHSKWIERIHSNMLSYHCNTNFMGYIGDHLLGEKGYLFGK